MEIVHAHKIQTVLVQLIIVIHATLVRYDMRYEREYTLEHTTHTHSVRSVHSNNKCDIIKCSKMVLQQKDKYTWN